MQAAPTRARPDEPGRRWIPPGSRAVGALLIGLGSLLAGCPAVDESSDVAYDDRFEATRMDVFVPHDGRTRRPAVMFIHGGGWSLGTRDELLVMARRLAGSGFVTATLGYRLVPDGVFPRAVQDVKCALAYLRGHATEYGLDPGRVAVFGYSSGAHLAAMVAVSAGTPEVEADCAAGVTSAPNAAICGSGLYDLRGTSAFGFVSAFVGGSEAERPHAYDAASPITYVRRGLPPFLLVHGADDWVVSLDQTTRMRGALRAAGNDTRYLELTDAGHFLVTSPDSAGLEIGADADDRPEVWAPMLEFLTDTLGAP